MEKKLKKLDGMQSVGAAVVLNKILVDFDK
jgi:hypothetical protein